MRLFPTLGTSLVSRDAGSADRLDVVETVAHAIHAGVRTVEVYTPSIAEKRLIVTRLMDALQTRIVLLSPNLAMQAIWHDRCEKFPPALADAARHIWGDVSLHPVSVLPYSCAPVVLLTIPSLPAGDGTNPGVDAARLSRHLVKFRYRLVLLDCVETLPASWQSVVDALCEQAHATVVRISHQGCDTSGLSTDSDGILRVSQSLPALVRDGVLPPFDVFARVADAGLPQSAGGVSGEDRQPVAKGRIDLLIDTMLREAGSMQDQLRSLVIVDAALGSNQAKRPDPDEMHGRVLLSAMCADERVASLHPILLTGSTIMCRDDMVIPLLSDIQRLVGMENWDVRLSHVAHEELSELHGSGADWNSRSYVIAVQELINRDITRCVIAEARLLKHGWLDTRVNTVFDISTGGPRSFFSQPLHAHEGPVEQAVPFVRYWDFLRATREGGAHTLRAWADRCSDTFLPSDDGVVERGAGGIHPGLSRVTRVPTAPDDIDLELIPERRVAARAWGVGSAYIGCETPAVSIHLPDGGNRSASLHHMNQIQRDITLYHERGSALNLQATLLGVLVVGVVLSAFLLLPLLSGAIVAGACTGIACLSLLRQWFRLRATQPSEASVPADEYLHLVGDALLAAMRAAGIVSPSGELAVTRRPNNWFRFVLRHAERSDAHAFASALLELFAEPIPSSHALLVSRVDTGRFGVRMLSRLPSLDVLYVNNGLLPIPSCLAADSLRRQAFERSFSSSVGRAVSTEIPGDPGTAAPAHPHIVCDGAVMSSIWE